MSEEIERQLAALTSPRGGAAHEQARRDAAAWCVEHGADVHDRLLALAQPPGPAPRAVLSVLASIGRAESVPALAALVRLGSTPTAIDAATALARHPDPDAGLALVALLTEASRPETAAAAAEGLAERGDARLTPALQTALHHDSSIVRYAAVRAAAALGALTDEDLRRIATVDSDVEIRDLARRLTSPR